MALKGIYGGGKVEREAVFFFFFFKQVLKGWGKWVNEEEF